MIRKLALAVAFATLLTGAAIAQSATTPPDTPAAGETGQGITQGPGQAATEMKDDEVKLTADPESCLKSASDLAIIAEERKVAESQLDKIDDLLIKMEQHCDARQFTEAHAVAKDIKSLIQPQ